MPTVEAITRDDIVAFFDALVPTRRDGDHGGRTTSTTTPWWTPSTRLRGMHGGELPRVWRRPNRWSTWSWTDDTEQAHLSLGWRSLPNHDDDR